MSDPNKSSGDEPVGVIQETQRRERWALLRDVDELTEKPLVFLSFVWLGLLIWELVAGQTPVLNALTQIIWVVFILDLLVDLWIAPRRLEYLRNNWLGVISVLLPAVRVLRVFRGLRFLRAARATRSLNLLKTLTGTRRGLGALNRTLRRRGIGYLLAMTLLLTLLGAAGLAHFENLQALRAAGYPSDTGLSGYGDALWWTAMIMTTMGSQYWPQSIEGRILAWLLAAYAFTFLGYTTATIASHFFSRDQESPEDEQIPEVTGEAGAQPTVRVRQADLNNIKQQLKMLQDELSGLSIQLDELQKHAGPDR